MGDAREQLASQTAPLELPELKRGHNSLIPAASLLPELLGEIFLWCRDATIELPSHRADTSWIYPSQVCTSWREAAIGYPRLWTTLTNSGPEERLKCMLSRSQALPLTIHFECWRAPLSYTAQSILASQVARLEGIRVTGPVEHLNEIPWPNGVAAPCLKVLQIRTSLNQWFPLDISTTPQLEELDLFNCLLDWDGEDIKKLKRLRVLKLQATTASYHTDDFEEDRRFPSTRDLVKTLEHMPDLVDLAISLPLKDVEATAAPIINQQVSFPRLQSLLIETMTTMQCSDFLPHLNLPHTTRINLSFEFEDTGSQDFTLLREALEASWLSSDGNSINTIKQSIDAFNTDWFVWAAYKYPVERYCGRRDTDGAALKLALLLPEDDEEDEETFRGTYRAIFQVFQCKLHQVETIYFEDPPAMVNWNIIINNLSSLKHLFMCYEPMVTDLVTLLLADPGFKDGTTSYLPQLQFLILSHIEWASPTNEKGTSLTALAKAFEERKRHGNALKKLSLENCSPLPENHQVCLDKVFDWWRTTEFLISGVKSPMSSVVPPCSQQAHLERGVAANCVSVIISFLFTPYFHL